MKSKIFVIVSVVLGGSLCMACGGDDDDDGGGGDALTTNCQKVCAMTEPLNCPMDPDDCVGECKSTATLFPDCKAQAEAAIACGASRPASEYACDAEGESTLTSDACSTQALALITCLFS
jgi:hypothetical protein